MPRRIDFDPKTGNIGLIGTYAKLYYSQEGKPVAPSSVEQNSCFTMIVEFDRRQLAQGVNLEEIFELAKIINNASMSWTENVDTILLTLDYALPRPLEKGRGFLIGMGRRIAICLSLEIGAEW